MEAQEIREEQSVTEDIDKHEVIDARDLLAHLKRKNSQQVKQQRCEVAER